MSLFSNPRRAERRRMEPRPPRRAGRRGLCPSPRAPFWKPRDGARSGCGRRPKHDFSSKCFDSIREARAYLTYKVPEMSQAECSENQEKIKSAEKIVQRADRRNQNRRLKKDGKTLTVGDKSFPTFKPKKEVILFEETVGPDGEIVRFKLLYRDNRFQKRLRTKEEPPVGSIILDLVSGVKAWRRYSDKRRSIPLTSEMRRSYQNSFLFKVRQLAAAKINVQQFIDIVKQSKIKSVRKLRRKNRKNR